MKRQGKWSLLLALAALGAGCDFQKDPDPGPAAVSPIRFVTIKVEYRQPAGLPEHDANAATTVWCSSEAG